MPRSGEDVARGPVTFGGVAWAQNRGVKAVEVRIDDGPWQQAQLGASYSNDAWRLVELPVARPKRLARTRFRCEPPITPARRRPSSGQTPSPTAPPAGTLSTSPSSRFARRHGIPNPHPARSLVPSVLSY